MNDVSLQSDHGHRTAMSPFFEDLHVGYSVVTQSRLVTREAIVDFARDWDPQPFHLDEIEAKSSFFGQLVGSGVHTYATTIRLCVDAGIFTGNAVAGLGFERLRFETPVYPGDVLSVSATVASLRESKSRPELGVVTWSLRTLEKSSGRCVLSVTVGNLFRRRAAALHVG